MEITDLTIKVLFLFIPGIISCIFISSLTESKDSSFQFFIKAFILGCISYLLLAAIYFLINTVLCPNPHLEVSFLITLSSNKTEINIYEILYVSACSILLALIISKIVNKAYLHKMARKIGISNKSGYRDLWDSLLSNNQVEWILVRDKSKNIMYEGWLEQFSSGHINGELFLRDVIVYNDSTGEMLYEIAGLYLVYNSDNMIIEFRQFVERKKKNGR